MSFARGLLLVLLVASPAIAQVQEQRWDHRGAVGLLVGGGADARSSHIAGTLDNGARGDLDLGGTVSITDRTELMLLGRLSLGGPTWVSLMAGIRSAYQLERWRTFFDLNAAAHLGSLWSVGPRIGLGVQYELHPVVGVYACFGAQIGWGIAGLRMLGELTVGFQFRSYLLE